MTDRRAHAFGARFGSCAQERTAALARRRTRRIPWQESPDLLLLVIVLCSLDDLIRSDQQRLRDRQAECFRGLHVDDQLERIRLLDGKVGGFGALEDAVPLARGLPCQFTLTRGVSQESAGVDKT